MLVSNFFNSRNGDVSKLTHIFNFRCDIATSNQLKTLLGSKLYICDSNISQHKTILLSLEISQINLYAKFRLSFKKFPFFIEFIPHLKN